MAIKKILVAGLGLMGGDKFLPCPLLSNMVAAGYYGVKSAKGFYDYPRR